MFKRIKGQEINWEKIFEKHTSHKQYIAKIYKEFLKVNDKKTNN